MDPISACRGPVNRVVLFQPGEKACNRAVINREGDLLFVASGDKIYGYNLMTEVCFCIYGGHDGVVEDVDIDRNSDSLVSVGADSKVIVHKVSQPDVCSVADTGKLMRCCCQHGGGLKFVAAVTSHQLRQEPTLLVYRVRPNGGLEQKWRLAFASPVNAVIWPQDDLLIVADTAGKLSMIAPPPSSSALPTIVKTIDAHRGAINSLTMSFDRKFFASASADTTACTWDMNLEKLGTFPHSFLVSSCAIAPNDVPHIVLASSADKKNVANTNFGSADFTINFFHLIFQEEFASMKVHKSTVNWVGYTPDGMTLVTTSQEGTCQIIRLGEEYEEMKRNHIEELARLSGERPGEKSESS
jgi:WD40 repeat protein